MIKLISTCQYLLVVKKSSNHEVILFFRLIYSNFMCMTILPACVYVCVSHAVLVLMEIRRGQWIPWD